MGSPRLEIFKQSVQCHDRLCGSASRNDSPTARHQTSQLLPEEGHEVVDELGGLVHAVEKENGATVTSDEALESDLHVVGR